jgi:uncharacterized protein YciI
MLKILAFALLMLLRTPNTALYYLVFIRPDPARKPLAQEEGTRIQTAHMENIRGMAANGSLVAAGPFEESPVTISGIFVLKADSLGAAQALAAEDPTVVEHRNTVDTHAWRAQAGIGDQYFRLHKEDPKTPEGMAQRPLVLLFRGPQWTAKSATSTVMLNRLHREGRPGAAGEIGGDENLSAVVVFMPGDLADARQVMESQPDIRSGAYRAEHHTWWCAANVLPWESIK